MRAFLCALLVCVLGACASTRGESSANPIELDSALKVAQVPAGKTSFVVVRYQPAVFGIGREPFDALTGIDVFGRQDTETEVFWLQHHSSLVPEGWQAKMRSLKAFRQVVREENSGSYTVRYYYNWLNLLFEITTPSNAKTGKQLVVVKVKSNTPGSDKTFDLPLNLDVVQK